MNNDNPLWPFPKTLPDGRTIIDEMCYCGALRSVHGGQIRHGGCPATKCEKFTWKDWVFEKVSR